MIFSIIIPVYNVEKYIGKCLESVVIQDFSSFEVIAVDDGSTDGSGKICDAYREKYSFVKVLHQKNAGPEAARNAGLEQAAGDWIIFVDGDDWIEDGMLRLLYEQMLEKDADIYSFNAYKTDEQGIVTDKLIFSAENKSHHFYNERARFEYFTNTLMQYKEGWEVCFRVFRRSIISQHMLRFQDCLQGFAEDYLFTFQYMLYVQKAEVICNLFYYYRQRDNSLIHSVNCMDTIGKLYGWADCAYDMVKGAGLRYFDKNFYLIYFMLINYHLNTMLVELPTESVTGSLQSLNINKRHKKWMKKLNAHKGELLKHMRMKKWL